MKKAQITPHSIRSDVPTYQGWVIDHVWACYKDNATKLPWTLVHTPTGRWVCFAAKKEHCQIFADEFNAIGDWSHGVPSVFTDTVYRAYNRARAKCELLDAEKALARKEKKRNV